MRSRNRWYPGCSISSRRPRPDRKSTSFASNVSLLWSVMIRRATGGSTISVKASRTTSTSRSPQFRFALPLPQRHLTKLSRQAGLDDGYSRHKRFLAQAAHELRTPVAILGARIASLPPGPDKTRLNEERQGCGPRPQPRAEDRPPARRRRCALGFRRRLHAHRAAASPSRPGKRKDKPRNQGSGARSQLSREKELSRLDLLRHARPFRDPVAMGDQ